VSFKLSIISGKMDKSTESVGVFIKRYHVPSPALDAGSKDTYATCKIRYNKFLHRLND
jgi:hypothetical protein